ncbi:hypothetical protein K488DRAFT_61904 [Vararia minispora EC-137]|uniref:Uncharacterized protein n=1 Tax=Vararia minispora EC-137 TaxID=1314806 RepID=A0ACB8Q6F5_9AGAM|nr:hypothetical protein K488DRAFT_61904 [Vararia minispora EC-137]
MLRVEPSVRNSDYALLHALSARLPRDLTRRSDEPPEILTAIAEAIESFEIVATYDMACITTVHLAHRFQENYPEFAALIEKIRWGIPVVHIINHKERCQYQYSTSYQASFARHHGETAEQAWAEMNQIGPIIRQMNSGCRQDTLNNHYGNWNWKKTIKIGM